MTYLPGLAAGVMEAGLLERVTRMSDGTRQRRVYRERECRRTRAGINVHVYAGRTSLPKEVGVALTQSNGSYFFAKRLATVPTLMFSEVNHYFRVGCVGTFTAPAGCASQTWDGITTFLTKVRTVTPSTKKR